MTANDESSRSTSPFELVGPAGIRVAVPRDAEAITAIYNDGIAGRQATLETRLREVDEISAWFAEPAPFLVSERDGVVVGWARAARYSARSAYDGVAEHAVYVDPSARGERRGRELLRALCGVAEHFGIFKLTSRVFTTNDASRAAHAAAGFLEVGVHPRHARLDGEWKDCVIVERLLGEAAENLPSDLVLVQARTALRVQEHNLLSACDELRTLVAELPFVEVGMEEEISDDARLIAAIFARSFTTFWAAVDLARSGFATQAAMLNRSLFEDMADIYWVSLEPAAAVERYRDHDLHRRMRLADAARASYDPADLTIPDFDPDERARLDARFGPFGEKPWSGLNLHRRVDRIEPLWEDPETLRFYKRIVHRDNNELLHLGARSLNKVVSSNTEDEFSLAIGPQGDDVDTALVAALWTFAQTARLATETFGLPLDGRLEALLQRVADRARPSRS